MEGKEVRFGIAQSALWATATTAASNGSVNAMHDSFTPLGGLVPMWLMQLGEIVFGGVGSGLYGMLMFAIVAVFVAGLMVGRTPEYLGKKIEAYEMKMASLVILIPPLLVLVGTAIACVDRGGQKGVLNPSRTASARSSTRFSSAAQQQRQRVRRPFGEHALLQHAARHLHVRRALLAHRPVARDRRLAREEEARAAVERHAADAHAALRRDARRPSSSSARSPSSPRSRSARSSSTCSPTDRDMKPQDRSHTPMTKTTSHCKTARSRCASGTRCSRPDRPKARLAPGRSGPTPAAPSGARSGAQALRGSHRQARDRRRFREARPAPPGRETR